MTTDKINVFIQAQNSIVCSKALVSLNCLNTFVHDCKMKLTYSSFINVKEVNIIDLRMTCNMYTWEFGL